MHPPRIFQYLRIFTKKNDSLKGEIKELTSAVNEHFIVAEKIVQDTTADDTLKGALDKAATFEAWQKKEKFLSAKSQ